MNRDNVSRICQHLSAYIGVKKIILYGSLVNDTLKKDIFSDCDIGIVVDDTDFTYSKESISWLADFGDIFGYEKHLEEDKVTIRICFEDFSRYDIVIVKESALVEKSINEIFGDDVQTIYTYKESEKVKKKNINKGGENINNIESDEVNRFWFVAVLAYCKIMRGDYLIGGHLILELMQETIILQMLERDDKKGTNVHRFGDKETINIFERTNNTNFKSNKESLLKLLKNACKVYDDEIVATENLYKSKYHIFDNWINTISL